MVTVFGFGKLHIIADMDGGWRTIGPLTTNAGFTRKTTSPLDSIRSPRGTRLFAFRLVVGLYLWGSAGVFFSLLALVEC